MVFKDLNMYLLENMFSFYFPLSGTHCTRQCFFFFFVFSKILLRFRNFGLNTRDAAILTPRSQLVNYVVIIAYIAFCWTHKLSASPILFDRAALAPGWSAVRYALQILHISPAFVVGIKNSWAVITDLNRMLLCGPGHAVKRLFMGAKKWVFFLSVSAGQRRTPCRDMSAAGRSTSLLTVARHWRPHCMNL